MFCHCCLFVKTLRNQEYFSGHSYPILTARTTSFKATLPLSDGVSPCNWLIAQLFEDAPCPPAFKCEKCPAIAVLIRSTKLSTPFPSCHLIVNVFNILIR